MRKVVFVRAVPGVGDAAEIEVGGNEGAKAAAGINRRRLKAAPGMLVVLEMTWAESSVGGRSKGEQTLRWRNYPCRSAAKVVVFAAR